MLTVDYTYYTEAFYGDILTETEFTKFVKRAEPYVSARTFGAADEVSNTSEYADKLKDTLCSVAELLKTHTGDDGIEHGAVASESVGGSWSRNYVNSSDTKSSIEDLIEAKIYTMLSNTGLLYGG